MRTKARQIATIAVAAMVFTGACIPTVTGDPEEPHGSDLHYIVFTGQSLAIGKKGTPPISTHSSHNNLTFSAGPRSGLDQLGSFAPLKENTNPGPDGQRDVGETPCSGAADRAAGLTGQPILCSTVGHSSFRSEELTKGSEWYRYLIGHVTAAHVNARATNRRLTIEAVGWLQGESNQYRVGVTAEEYAADLLDYQSDVDADVRAITGQAAPVHLLTYQTAAYARLNPRVTLGQLQASVQSDRVFLVTPIYHLPTVDGVHLTAVGYRLLGEYFGRVLGWIVEKRYWRPLSPLSATVQGRVIQVRFHVPSPPLVLDPAHLAEGYGFSVIDDLRRHPVNRVTLVSDTEVEIEYLYDLSTNPRLRYGLDWLGTGLTIVGGASGNLRDSDHEAWVHNGRAYPLYNWCVQFETPLRARDDGNG